ncbi:hypothetical protein HanIR_Chr12g0561441 [Helianthus annuus]|nr:hypothetical protein HanIR_Chr12g0561441 [Helianthus annuus]
MLMLRISAERHQCRILMCNLMVLDEWLSIKSFYSLATVPLHNAYVLDTEEFDCLCCNKTCASNFDTAKTDIFIIKF